MSLMPHSKPACRMAADPAVGAVELTIEARTRSLAGTFTVRRLLHHVYANACMPSWSALAAA